MTHPGAELPPKSEPVRYLCARICGHLSDLRALPAGATPAACRAETIVILRELLTHLMGESLSC